MANPSAWRHQQLMNEWTEKYAPWLPPIAQDGEWGPASGHRVSQIKWLAGLPEHRNGDYSDAFEQILKHGVVPIRGVIGWPGVERGRDRRAAAKRAAERVHGYLLIDGCPCPGWVAPYVFLVLREAGQVAASIYRGEDAAALLHAHGKHTQGELYDLHRADPVHYAPANPPGRSEHELRSDGLANRGPAGRRLANWQIGVDSGGNDQASQDAVERAAARLGWEVRHPYSSGVEGHHWCFAREPSPNRHVHESTILQVRATLPTR